MNKLLIIANEFPPIGGSGVQRTTNLVKHLPKNNVKPYVITKKYQYGLYDDSLLKNIPEEAEIYRLESFDFANRSGFFGKLLRFISTRFFVPDMEVFWYLKNRKKVLKLVKDKKIEYIYSTSFPYSDHLMARYLKKNIKSLKWVADFRDEWTNNPYFTEKLHMKIRCIFEKPMEKSIVENCDFLITNTPFMLENFLKDSPEKREKATFVPNGYNEKDFENYKVQNQDNKVYKMVYMGALYGKRKPDYFLKALQEAISDGDIPKNKIRIEFIGNYHSHVMNELKKKYNLEDVMVVTGYMSHDALIEHMSFSNLLILIESEKNFYTGKIFEYIRMGIPILGVLPKDGAAASVIYKTCTGEVAEFENIKEIKEKIISYYKMWQDGKKIFSPKKDEIYKYSWDFHAKSILKCFEEIKRK